MSIHVKQSEWNLNLSNMKLNQNNGNAKHNFMLNV